MQRARQHWLNLPQTTRGVLAGIASAVFLTAYLVTNKYIYNTYDIGALEYSLLFAIAGGIFGLLSLRRHMDKTAFLAVKRDARRLVILSLTSFVAVGLLVIGQRYTSSVNASLITTATILTTMFFSAIMLREYIDVRQRIWLIFMFFGMYIAIVGFHRASLNSGDSIILAAEIAFGFGNVYGRKLMRTHGSVIVPNVRLVLAAIYAFIVGLFVFQSFDVIEIIWPLALLAGLFYWLTMKTFALSVHLVDANHAIVLNNGQIVTTALAGVLLLGEHYTIEKLIGSAIVLASIYCIAWKRRS